MVTAKSRASRSASTVSGRVYSRSKYRSRDVAGCATRGVEAAPQGGPQPGPSASALGLGLAGARRGRARGSAGLIRHALVRRAEALEAVHHQVVLVAREAYQVPPVVREPVHVHVFEAGHGVHLFFFCSARDVFARA
jgi:hypothetical protein